MNSVIWYLYLADILGGIIDALSVIIVLSILAGIGLTIMTIYNYCEDNMDDTPAKVIVKGLRISIIVCVISTIVGILLPMPRTIYAAAGIKVIKESETCQCVDDNIQSILQDIKTIIHKQAEK